MLLLTVRIARVPVGHPEVKHGVEQQTAVWGQEHGGRGGWYPHILSLVSRLYYLVSVLSSLCIIYSVLSSLRIQGEMLPSPGPATDCAVHRLGRTVQVPSQHCTPLYRGREEQ